MSLQTTYCYHHKLAARDKQPVKACFRHAGTIHDLLPFLSVQMCFYCSFLPECCCHLVPPAAVLELIRLQLNMSSSYAAAISALLTASSSNSPVKPSPHSSPGTTGSPKPSPQPNEPPHTPPAVQIHPHSPEHLGSYEEQQENPADYGIGRQHP